MTGTLAEMATLSMGMSHDLEVAIEEGATYVRVGTALFGKNPFDLYFYMYQGAFGTWFSWQNTLTRAAPLILTALCTALPAQLGMVIIGGEGALLIGALFSGG